MGNRRLNTRRIAIVAAVCCIVGTAPAQASRTSAADRVQQTVSEGYTVKLSFDSRDRATATALRGRRSVRSRTAGGRVRSASIAPASLRSATASASNYTCVENRKRRGFVAYTPLPMTRSNDARYLRFVYHRYKQNRARRFNRDEPGEYVSKQIEVCSVGGGQSRGGNRLSRVVTMMTMKSSDRLIGQKWDSGEEQSKANASLTFAVPVKPVDISATINVHPTYKLTGGQGPDKQGPDSFEPIAYNQVNAAWEGSSTFRWQGSTHFQGNVGHALWELPQSQPTPEIYYSMNHERFCGRPPPFSCA